MVNFPPVRSGRGTARGGEEACCAFGSGTATYLNEDVECPPAAQLTGCLAGLASGRYCLP